MMKLMIFFVLLLLSFPLVAQDEDITGEWELLENMNTSRTEFATVLLDGKIYAAGGLLQMWEGKEIFEVYDIASDTWTELTPTPVTMHHPSMAALDGKIYLAGGWQDRRTRLDTLWMYDPETDEWSEVSTLPDYRMAFGMVTVNDKLYFVGGVWGNEQLETDVVWSYDPEADEWVTDLAPMPTARESLAVAVFDGKIYTEGGRKSFGRTLKGLEVYDPETDEWTNLTASDTERAGHTMVALDGRLHVLGGETSDDPPGMVRIHEVYDPETDTWLTAPLQPRWALHGVNAEVYEDTLYLIGGSIQAGGNTADGALRQLLAFKLSE